MTDPTDRGPSEPLASIEERLAAMEATSASLAASVATLIARPDAATEEHGPAEQAGSLRLPIVMLADARDALVSSPAACRALEVASILRVGSPLERRHVAAMDIQGATAGEPLHVPTVAIACSAEASRARDWPLRRYIDEINIATMREAVVATVQQVFNVTIGVR